LRVCLVLITLVSIPASADDKPVDDPTPTQDDTTTTKPTMPAPPDEERSDKVEEPTKNDKAKDEEAKRENKKTKKAKKAKKKGKPRLSFGGRIFARESLLHTANDPWLAQASLVSARAKADFKQRNLRAQIEIELADKARVKDAYAQLRLHDHGPRVDVRAGNFKMPFSSIQLQSIWTLPMADRGLIDNVLVKRLQLAGRAVGTTCAIEASGGWRPRIDAGVFQGSDDAGNALAASASDGFGQDAVVRGSVKPTRGVELGVGGSVRAGGLIAAPFVVQHGYANEVDATIETTLGPGHLRMWLEGMIGTSWLVGGNAPGHTRTRFLETRGIVGYRFGNEARWSRYVELYGLAGAIDPDRKFKSDTVLEVTGGISYGASDVWRIQAEVEVWRIGAAAPLGIAEFAVAPVDSTSFLLQFGARL